MPPTKFSAAAVRRERIFRTYSLFLPLPTPPTILYFMFIQSVTLLLGVEKICVDMIPVVACKELFKV